MATINPQLFQIKKLALRLNATAEKAMAIVQGDQSKGKVEAMQAAGLAQLAVKPLEEACQNLGVNLAGVCQLEEPTKELTDESELAQLLEQLQSAIEELVDNAVAQLGIDKDELTNSLPHYVDQLLQIAESIADMAEAHLSAASQPASV